MTNFPETVATYPYRPGCVLRVAGPDAATFLQGQFTNDLGPVAPAGAVYGLWLDRKGRVIADSHVVRDASGEGFWVVSLASPAATVMRRLEDYIVADEVAIEDVTPAWDAVSLIGEGAGEWLAREPRAGLTFRGRRNAGESWEWLYPSSEAGSAGAALAGARSISADEVARMRIASRIPSVPADIGPSDLPNEAGLESDAISYSKGCYLGQEVMARLKSMGRVRRALVRVEGAGTPPCVPAALWLGARHEGELRSVAPDAGGRGYTGLALVPLATAYSGGPLALSQDGPANVIIVRKT